MGEIKFNPPKRFNPECEFECPHCPCYVEGERCCGCGERKDDGQKYVSSMLKIEVID